MINKINVCPENTFSDNNRKRVAKKPHSESSYRGQANPLNRTVTIWPISASADCTHRPHARTHTTTAATFTHTYTHTYFLTFGCLPRAIIASTVSLLLYLHISRAVQRPVHKVTALREEEDWQILKQEDPLHFGQMKTIIKKILKIKHFFFSWTSGLKWLLN